MEESRLDLLTGSRNENFGFYKRRDIPFLAKFLADSQEELCLTWLVVFNYYQNKVNAYKVTLHKLFKYL
jgi:hypothetical protein